MIYSPKVQFRVVVRDLGVKNAYLETLLYFYSLCIEYINKNILYILLKAITDQSCLCDAVVSLK